MKQSLFTPIAILALSLSMSLPTLWVQTPIAHAQIDEARKTNWENAKKLYPLLVDATNAQKRDEVWKLTDELAANLEIMSKKLELVGQYLHPKDRNWAWSAKRNAALQTLTQTRNAVLKLGTTSKQVGTSMDSDLSTVKNEWQKFGPSVDDLWSEYVMHGKELEAIVRSFNEECRGCR
jgi:hypothetical protein